MHRKYSTSLVAELAASIAGQVVIDEAALVEMSGDFGRVAVHKPAVVARPASPGDVAETVKFARRHSLQVTARGAGHSQNGLSLSSQILLDLRGLNDGVRVDADRLSVSCPSGITWRALLAKLQPLGLSPPVLTNNLDVTVGGTLSTGGLGVASWRHGTQADQCLELEVVTAEGERVRCSAESNSELFNAVRAGLGWFGVMTEAKLRLRRHKPNFHSSYLLYDDLDALLADLKTLMSEERFDYLESWCVPLPQGLKKVDGHCQPFAQWFYPLHCTIETEDAGPVGLIGPAGTNDAAPALERLRGLHYYKHSHTETGGMEEFFSRLDPLFDLWKAGGFWEMSHPWMECILPWTSAPGTINQVIERIPPQFLTGGHTLLWPARGDATTVPLLMRPEEHHLMGFGLLPAVPSHLLARALPLLKQASQAATAMGGKKYLSGWLDFDSSDWKAHFGSETPKIIELKRKFDPSGVFGRFPL